MVVMAVNLSDNPLQLEQVNNMQPYQPAGLHMCRGGSYFLPTLHLSAGYRYL